MSKISEPAVATAEALSSGVLSILAFTLPFLAAVLVIGLLITAIVKLPKFISTWRRKRGKASWED